MSYANIGSSNKNKPKGAYTKVARDEESAANLLSSDGQQ